MTRRRTLVVVEGDPAARAALAGMFAEQGVSARLAADGTEAIRLLTHAHEGASAERDVFALIIDIDAAGRSGLDVAAMVREREWPVNVFVTWRREGDLRDAIIRLGASALRRRPESLAGWLALVRDVERDTRPRPRRGALAEKVAPALTALVGCWLFASAFLWPHSRAQLCSAIVVGAMGVVLGATTLARKRRGVQAAALLGLLLSGSMLVLPWQATTTLWNHLLVGGGLVALGLAAERGRHGDGRWVTG